MVFSVPNCSITKIFIVIKYRDNCWSICPFFWPSIGDLTHKKTKKALCVTGGCEERKETVKINERRGPKGSRGMELGRGFHMIKVLIPMELWNKHLIHSLLCLEKPRHRKRHICSGKNRSQAYDSAFQNGPLPPRKLFLLRHPPHTPTYLVNI